MKITEIIVHEGRGYNHPYESFSNFKQGVTFRANIYESENFIDITKQLQEKAAVQIEAIKNKTLEFLKEINSLEVAKRQAESDLKCAQYLIDAKREKEEESNTTF